VVVRLGMAATSVITWVVLLGLSSAWNGLGTVASEIKESGHECEYHTTALEIPLFRVRSGFIVRRVAEVTSLDWKLC
jgi:hypothetical protein